jgi:hypothetical protein
MGKIVLLSYLILCALFLANPYAVLAANYPLEIIQPQAGLTTTNRFYKAYTGLEYNVRAAVIGGAYPYTYSLTTAPAGMVINQDTGTISWPSPPDGDPNNVTLLVTDAENTTATVSWTITVTTSGFYFIDAINGEHAIGFGCSSNCGTGTISNPWKSIIDMYEGDVYASKTASSYANGFLYFKSGTYVMDGYIEDGSRMAISTSKPVVWMAYPGDSPVLDFSYGHLAIYGGQNNTYFDGFEVTPMNPPGSAYGIQIDSNATNVTFRRLKMHNLPATTGSNNQAAIRISQGGDTPGTYWAIQDNTFYDIHHGFGIIAYFVNRVLVEDNTLYNIDDPLGGDTAHGIGPKDTTNMWFIRHNNLYNISDGSGIWVGMYNGHRVDDVEISFNYSQANAEAKAFDLNQNVQTPAGLVYVCRNTFVGVSEIRAVTGTGPIYMYNNVLQYAAPQIIGTLTTLVDESNLKATSGLVDASGLLVNRDYVGTYGWELGTSDTTPPTVPVFTIPATYTSLTVPINSFTVADETALHANPYCVTTTNSSAGCSWQASAPTSVTFGAAGSQTAYAWARDAALNVSDAVTDSVEITLPPGGFAQASGSFSIH